MFPFHPPPLQFLMSMPPKYRQTTTAKHTSRPPSRCLAPSCVFHHLYTSLEPPPTPPTTQGIVPPSPPLRAPPKTAMKRPLTHLLHSRFQTAPSTAMHLRTHTSQSPLMVIKTSASLRYIFKTEPPCVIMHLHKIHSNRKHTKPELNHMKTWLTMHHHEACLHAAVEHLKRFKSYNQSTHNHHGQ